MSKEIKVQTSASKRSGRFMRTLLLIANIFFFGIALPCLTGEVFARITYTKWVPSNYRGIYENFLHATSSAATYYYYRAHPYSVYEPNPDYRSSYGEKLHTEDAFRYPEMSFEKSENTYRIVLLGGSNVYDNDTTLLQTYGAWLEEYLNLLFPGKNIQILNAAVGGYNSADSFARFHFKVLDYSPDMVIVQHSMSDVWPRVFRPKEFRNDYRNSRKPMDRFEPPSSWQLSWLRRSILLKVLYFQFVLKGAIPDIMQVTYQSANVGMYQNFQSSSPSALQRNLEDIVFIARSRGIAVVLATDPYNDLFYEHPDVTKDSYYVLVLGTQEHNEVIRHIAKDTSAVLVDLENAIPKDKDKKYFGDVAHTSVKGSRLKAKLVGDGIKTFLEERFQTKAVPVNFTVSEGFNQPDAVLKR
jgi:lysophospholipase L1-like esterase